MEAGAAEAVSGVGTFGGMGIDGEGGRVTVGMLADLVRGVGGKAFQVPSGGGKGRRRKSQGEKVGLDLEGIAGGKISLSKDVSNLAVSTFIT